MTHGSLFSGIGGFDLAAEWAGWENIFHCEWNPFGQKVLKYYWPNAISYHDITKTDFTIHRRAIDILTGGFPCQPYSAAGKRKGKDDDRHLWPEMLRAIREIQPTWVVGENVRGLTNWNGGLVFDEVQADLENEGYEVTPFLLPAASVQAPHERYRIWFVAHNLHPTKPQVDSGNQRKTYKQVQEGNDVRDRSGTVASSRQTSSSCLGQVRDFKSFPTVSPVWVRNDGLPSELDGITVSKWRNESIKAGGNAIVPQVAYQIFKAINQYESL